jgi:hypothetical protein
MASVVVAAAVLIIIGAKKHYEKKRDQKLFDQKLGDDGEFLDSPPEYEANNAHHERSLPKKGRKFATMLSSKGRKERHAADRSLEVY